MPVRVDNDRSLGALLGMAAGDAAVASAAGGRATSTVEMAICLARAVISSGGFDATQAVGEYIAWHATGPAGVGATTRGALERLGNGSGPFEAAREQHEASGGRSAGNGALLRTTPIAIAFAGNDDGLREATVEDASLTHYDPLASKAAVLHNQVVAWCATRGPDAPSEELRDATWLDDRLEPVVVNAFGGLRDVAAKDAADGGSFVLASLEAALTAFFTAESFDEGLGWVLGIGGDTRTNATVAGALLGARFGAAAIPSERLAAVERRADLETLHGYLVKLA